MTDGIMEAAHYEKTRRALTADPIVKAMYEDLPAELRLALSHETVEDRYGLMTMVLREYNDRGGEISTHIGGPLEALEILARQEYHVCEQTSAHGAPRKAAEVYAIDPIPDGWGGYYCQSCADSLRFQVVDRLGEGGVRQ